MRVISKIYLISLIFILQGCNLTPPKNITFTNNRFKDKFNEQISQYYSKMETGEDFNKEELTILLKQYNTIQVLKHENNKTHKKYIKLFKNIYLEKVMSEFDFKISKGMVLYSDKLDMHILPSSRISENDTYNIKN
ncbi:hypothetical protein [uncultured Aquimarina sp.]|uniref:hypothetical protein n=1 Tax=uncultured Aquimarina sp. TaxID=575652 RepID=UPI00260AEAF9|nr:hypothetical protein [uncultured Aquimarina sp.]